MTRATRADRERAAAPRRHCRTAGPSTSTTRGMPPLRRRTSKRIECATSVDTACCCSTSSTLHVRLSPLFSLPDTNRLCAPVTLSPVLDADAGPPRRSRVPQQGDGRRVRDPLQLRVVPARKVIERTREGHPVPVRVRTGERREPAPGQAERRPARGGHHPVVAEHTQPGRGTLLVRPSLSIRRRLTE